MKNSIFSLILLTFSVGAFSQKPGYYNGTEGKKGDELKAVLHEIINDHIDFSYSDAKYILEYAQEDPTNSSNLISFYTGRSIAKGQSSWGTSGDLLNREHVWAKSHGNFSDIRPMDGDAHNLHAADATVNVTRSNYDFDNIEGGIYISEADAYYGGGAFEPADREKGEVARTIMYMAVRYEGTNGEIDLELADKVGTYPNPEHGKLSTLLQWNKDFPPSDFERKRNDRVEQSQGNRNPFTDNPDWADLIWGNAELSDVSIGNVRLEPVYPAKDDAAIMHVEVTTVLGALPGATVHYGASLNADTYSIAMYGQGTLNASLNLSPFNAGDQVYYKIMAESGDSLCGSFYLAPEEQLVSMSAIQGTGNSSPLAGQTVATGGIVTANFDNAFTMQSAGDRNSLTVYSNWRGHIGDSVIVKGKIYEYKGLTEISPATMVFSYGHKREIIPDTLTIAELSESNESEVIVINKATFIDGGESFEQGGGTYILKDGSKELNVYVRYNSRLAGKTIPNGTVAVKGIYTEYDGSYQLIINDMSWITTVVDNSAPEIVNVEVIDKDWVYIYFNETITAECAGNSTNFSFDGGLNILGTYHYPPNKAIVMVGNLQAKNYNVTVKNIEDISGNVLDEASFEFTSTISTSVRDTKANSTLLYPNPSNGQLTIQSDNPMRQISLINLMGVNLGLIELNNATSRHLDFGSLKSGIYFLVVDLQDGSRSKLRLVID